MNKRQKAIAQAVPSRVMTATEFEYATDNYKEFRKSRKMTNTQFKEYRDTISEGKFSKSLIAKAIKIAKKSSGNMTAAFNAIEKLKKGLGDDPEVSDALRLANESKKEDDEENALLDKEALGEAKAVAGGKVHKFIKGHNLPIDGKKYKEIEFETKGIDNATKTVKLMVIHPKKIFGKEFNVPFRTLRMGPFTKLDIPNQMEALGEALKPKDKKAVDAFYDGKGLTLEPGQTLHTDGITLKSTGIGAQTIATKVGGKFKIVAKMDGRFTQSVVKYIKKSFPKNLIKEEVELDEKKDVWFKAGDKVKIKTSGLTRMTERGFKKFLGKSGKVVKDYGDGDIKLNLGGNNDIVIDRKDLVKEEVELDEVKMNDPKLNKLFDKLKKGSKVKFKISSTIAKGKEFTEYMVTAKNTVNKGRVEKITLVTKENPKSVKKYLYRRDGKVTFAIGDMGASIDDFQESYQMKNSFSQYLSEGSFKFQSELKPLKGIFDPKDGEKWAKEIQKGINAPVVQVTTSSLGGVERMSIMVKFSMDKEAAKGGTAWHNSRHANLRVDIDGSMEMFMASHKFGIKKMRKAKIKSAKDVIKKINDWIKKVPAIKEEVQEEVLAEAYKYKIDHKTYTSAVEEALVVAEKAKYEVDMDDYFNSIATGPRKPGEGKTNTFKIALTKNGKEQRKKLQIQIYGKGKHGYELNCYIA